MTRQDDTFTDKFRTQDEPLTRLVSYVLPMPAALWFIAQVADALYSMTYESNWEQGGDVTVSEAVEASVDMFRGFKPMVGTMFPVTWDTIPDNFLLCDGATHDREDYPALYAVLPAVFIVDADTFTVPDMRNRVPVGAGDDFSVGDTGGEQEHTLTEAEIPTHAHTYVPPVFNVDIEAPGAPDPIAAGIGLPTNTGNAGGGDAHNNMQPYVALQWVIWAR